MILLITNKKDVTTDLVVSNLNNLNALYYRFNTEDLGKHINITLDFFNNKFILYDNLKKRTINLKEIKSIYYRRPELPSYKHLKLKEEERIFLIHESLYILEGVYRLLQNCFWISNPFKIREAENKIYQLTTAEKLGFNIPKSIISDVRNDIENFLEKNKQLIIKPIKTGILGELDEEKFIFTNNINFTEEKRARIKNFPCYIQNKILKDSDLRVTIVGGKIFSVKIFPQNEALDTTDWRRNLKKVQYEITNIPLYVEKQCLSLMKFLDINFGAIDFAVEDGQYIFLEINPNGQWGWLDIQLRVGICDEITKLLVENT